MDVKIVSLYVNVFVYFSISSGWEPVFQEWGVEIVKNGNNDLSKIAKRIAEKHDLEYIRSVNNNLTLIIVSYVDAVVLYIGFCTFRCQRNSCLNIFISELSRKRSAILVLCRILC